MRVGQLIFCLVGRAGRSALGVLLAAGWALGGQAQELAGKEGELFRFRQPKRQRTAVPLRVERNLPVVRATLNGAGPFNFLLDTGVSTSLITNPRLADSLRLPHGAQFRVVGAGREATGLLAYQADGVRVELGPNVVAPALTWLVLSEDVLNLSGYVGMPIAGILGSELFRSFVVRFEPEAGRLGLAAPATYRPPKGRHWVQVPLQLAQNKAYLTLPVALTDSAARPLKLVLDTGAGHALSLETDALPLRVALPARRLPAELGRGLTGIVRGHLGRVDSLRLGRYRIPAVLTSFPAPNPLAVRPDEPRDGNLGYEVLKRFTLVLDYPHHRLWLRPNIRFAEPFEHNMSGLELRAGGYALRRYAVATVAPDSPAAKAGILVDDELLSVNFAAASVLSLTQLSRLLQSADNHLLFLTLRHADGELYTTYLRLKRQI